MANEYKLKFDNLKCKLGDYEYFSQVNLPVYIDNEEEIFNIIRFNLNKDIIDNAIELAAKKSKYTMSYDQSGKKRPNNIKLANQTKGILAEIGVQLILEKILQAPQVKRWDLERDSFEYSDEEYDVKFAYNGKEFVCESRSSTSYKTSLNEFIGRYHVIGSYTSVRKHSEGNNAFYFRPVFQYKNYNKEWTELPYEKKTNTLMDLDSGELELYFVSGATLKEMNGPYSESGNNNQGRTMYNQIRMIHTGDINDFLEKLVYTAKKLAK